jgi:hypothetical protein
LLIGIQDKRLLVTETEFAKVLAVMERQGNSLSPVLRDAWDGGVLSTMTKTSPLKATGAHISIIGHITEYELQTRVTQTDAANGLVNRFMFFCVKRSKLLPFGGEDLDEDAFRSLVDQISRAIEFAKSVGQVRMTAAAREIWASEYEKLTADQAGLLGAVIARSEAQVVRLALLYALLDHRDVIDAVHLQAAQAVWDYSEASAVRIFGDALGDPVADEILRALQQANDGLTRTAIRRLFGGHQSSDRISVALGSLLKNGRARPESNKTGGRPVETWFAVRG